MTFPNRPTATIDDVIRKIRNIIKMVYPSTQRENTANKCGVSLGTVNTVIVKILKAKLRKKRRVYRLSGTHILKRRARS